MIDRRRFLKGAGALTVGLPALSAFSRGARASGDEAPRRMITMAYLMGTHLPAWVPSNTGTDFTVGPICEAMAPFRDRALWISNVPNSVIELGGSAYVSGHPGKPESVLTGTLLQHAFGGNGANTVENVQEVSPNDHARTPNGPSVDQFIGDFLADGSHPRASVDLGIEGPRGIGEPTPSGFFYEAASNPVSMQLHPGVAFATLFNGVRPDGMVDEEYLRLQRRKASVLDAVRANFTDLRQGLSASDRRVLDDHADKIRQIELDMPPLAACTVPGDIAEGDDAYSDASMSDLAPLMNRIMAHSMACGLAPIGRLEFLVQQDPFFGIPMIDEATSGSTDWHHPIVHAADGWSKDDPVRVRGFKFFVDMFADLLTRLDSIEEGPDGRTVLDNSLVLLCSNFGEGQYHQAKDLCFLVAGGSGPGRRGLHFDGNDYTSNDVLTTLCHMACVEQDDGSPVEAFGLEGFGAGPIGGLLS